MKHIAWLVVVAAGACKGNETKPAPAQPNVVPTVEPDLITAVCAMTLLPSVHANSSRVAVIQTADGKRHPWIIRDYQHQAIEELEKELWMPHANDPKLTSSKFPTSFCRLTGPIYATLRLYNPDDKQTWVLAGKLGALTKQAVEKDRLDNDSQTRGIELVIEELAKDGRTKPTLVWFEEADSTRTTGLSGSWVTAFEELVRRR